jgi:hypothetical protein
MESYSNPITFWSSSSSCPQINAMCCRRLTSQCPASGSWFLYQLSVAA